VSTPQQGLLLIRKLWDAGIAHRDVKPGNLMVRSGDLLLIDVAFVQVRPSPWRQAVDLGNMMLVLAVRTDPERVYRRALRYFTPDELAEAFAATRGPASPSQLRAFMKRDPRDLLGEFRALAPQRPPIAIQRWSIQRVALTAALLAVALVAVFIGGADRRPGRQPGHLRPPLRHRPLDDPQRPGRPLRRAAALHRRTPHGLEHQRRRHRQRAHQVLAGLRPRRTARHHRHPDRCLRHLRRSADPIRPSGHAALRAPLSLQPHFADRRFYTFPGGCVTYQFSFAPGASPVLVAAVDSALSFQPRSVLVDFIRRTEGLALCGRGAPCPR
jgi:serine/threonine protein kinase